MSNMTLSNPELTQVEIHGTTRSAFLLRTALGAGALFGAGAASPVLQRAFAQEGGGDVAIVQFALTLEHLEAAFYRQALDQLDGASADVRSLAREIGKNEDAHVDALSAAIRDLGGMPEEAPMVNFGDAFGSQDSFLELATTLEDTGVAAYNGAGAGLESKELLGAAGGIVQVEARHAALIRLLAGQPPAPEAFDAPMERQAVLDAVQPFIR
jgi:Ferritin-like domain